MGKGSRVRAGRQVARRGRPAPSTGAAFGIGVGPRAHTGLEAPPARRNGVVDRVRDQDAVWRAAARVTDALVHLEELAAARPARTWRCAVVLSDPPTKPGTPSRTSPPVRSDARVGGADALGGGDR